MSPRCPLFRGSTVLLQSPFLGIYVSTFSFPRFHVLIPPFPFPRSTAAGIGMFVYTELAQIVLLVVRRLSISGFYSAHVDCPLLTTGESLNTIIHQMM